MNAPVLGGALQSLGDAARLGILAVVLIGVLFVLGFLFVTRA